MWLHLPMISAETTSKQFERNLEEVNDDDDTWNWWNTFRCVANFEKKLSLALELTADLPDETTLDRWLGEPIRCLVIPTHLFQTNKKGFPVLSKAHQSVINKFIRQKVQTMITGALHHQHYKNYQQYIDHLWQVTNTLSYPKYLTNSLKQISSNLKTIV